MMIMNYEEFLIESILKETLDKSLNESLIIEKINFDKMINAIKSIKNKRQAISKLIDKFNNTKNKITKKNIAVLLIIIYFGHNIINNSSISYLFRPKIEQASEQLSKKNMVTIKDLNEIPGASFLIGKQIEKISNYVNIKTVKISDDGINLIKDHEKLSLKAYKIGDGMITIGWGHANPIKNSPYKIGDTITKQKADELFKKDIKYFEEGVRRMLLQWEEEGHDVKITQSMFDAMVSLAYNMGVGGLRRSEFIKHVKKQDFLKAAELIKTTKVSDKFPGLYDRRETESNLFLKDFDMT